MIVLFHTLHLVCAIFWLGSLLYTELILWPRLRAMGQLAEVQGALRSPGGRRLMAVAIVGTVLFGLLRGAAAGALDQLGEPYGQLFLLAALVGTAMMVWWLSFPSRAMRLGWRLYYLGFAVMLGLMVAMRFACCGDRT